MANSNLTNARNAKNDEFYTQYLDVAKEIEAYLEYNPDIFRGKTVLLPCDDPEWSNFTKFFAQNFEAFGLKKLISTSYAHNSKSYGGVYTATLFESENPQFDEKKTSSHGKIFTLTHDTSGDGKIDVNDLRWEYLEGSGDFKSNEIKKLRDEADIIITNPPFSLFREFIAWLMEADKQFLVIGNMNAISYKELFPFIKKNIIWLGFSSGAKIYIKPDKTEQKMGNTCWFTNLDYGDRHKPLKLSTMEDNLKFTKFKDIQGKDGYDKYDNYDAIEIPITKAIPSDFTGVMGVPISFLEKYSPEQFEILGITDRDNISGLRTKTYTTQDAPNPGDLNRRAVIKIGNTYKATYVRILIKHKNPTI